MKEIIKQVIRGKSHIQIGKAGISDGIIRQIQSLFKSKKIIKVKFLNIASALEMKNETKKLARIVNAKILDIRGHTCVLMEIKEVRK